MAKGKYQEWIEPNGILRLTAWKRDGLTDEQIAKNMGIHVSTLYKWQNEYKEINEALKSGKEVADIQVENALFKKTIGYTVDLRKTFKVKRTKYNDKGYKIEEYEELVDGYDEIYITPDTTAQIFWLQNRKPNEWKDKRNLEIAGKDGGAIEFDSPLDRLEKKLSLMATRNEPNTE